MHLLLHDLFVIHRVPNINVGFIWHMCHGRVQVEDVWRRVLAVEVRVETLHQGRFSLCRTSQVLERFVPCEQWA